MNDGRKANKLINESSPYLREHAYNPVDWFPWCKDAFDKARIEDKPIIVSIGYSACHWCHVMAHECFEDPQVATLMNENFVCIKVDREERPDIDAIYMNACFLMTGRGGWPLNCFATPDGIPFFCGTYFPKDHWMSILMQITYIWKNNRQKIYEVVKEVMDGMHAIKTSIVNVGKASISPDVIQASIHNMIPHFDMRNGGFDSAPKFPTPPTLHYLMLWYFYSSLKPEYVQEVQDKDIIKRFLIITMDNMSRGGIYDHVGGGFARYSTDEAWRIPHFEKMLYDNAQMIALYSIAYLLFKKEKYKDVVYETFSFLVENMRHRDGGFFSSVDADWNNIEGGYYIWRSEELANALNDLYPIARVVFSIEEDGNWEHGYNVLYMRKSIEEYAEELNMPAPQLKEKIKIIKSILKQERMKRQPPRIDDKILSSWNAMLISALCTAYKVFTDERFKEVALSCADFIINKMFDGKMLVHSWKDNNVISTQLLEDYAFVIDALLKLTEITEDEKYFEVARQLCKIVINNFYDEKLGFFVYAHKEQNDLFVNHVELHDNVIPSPVSVMASNLHILYLITGKPEYRNILVGLLEKVGKRLTSQSRWMGNWGVVALRFNGPFWGVISRETSPQQEITLLRASILNAIKIPYQIYEKYGGGMPEAGESHGLSIYMCEMGACGPPLSSIDEALKKLGVSEIINEKHE